MNISRILAPISQATADALQTITTTPSCLYLKDNIMKNVLLITGPGGDAQGWGDMRVTECMRDALNAGGFDTTIAWIETPADFDKALAARNYDIVWSALYYITPRADIIGLSEAGDVWVADLLDERGVPYIGPSAQTMKNLIDKATTHRILLEHGVYVPANKQVKIGAPMPEFTYPAFVKPCAESRSVGISDASVVHSPEELERQVKYIHDNFKQARGRRIPARPGIYRAGAGRR